MHKDQRTFGEKVSDIISRFASSWKFIFFGFGVIISWVWAQTFISWDAYPYILLNLGLSIVAAFQAPFILMAQRRCEMKQDAIYRSLFKEIKELVEHDITVEYEIVARNQELERDLKTIKELLLKLAADKMPKK